MAAMHSNDARPLRLISRVILALIFFVVGASLAFVVLALLYDFFNLSRGTSRPLRTRETIIAVIWPIICGGLAALQGIYWIENRARITRAVRALMAFSLMWSLLVIAAAALFGPRYWRSAEWSQFSAVLLGPIILGIIALPLLGWVRKGK